MTLQDVVSLLLTAVAVYLVAIHLDGDQGGGPCY